MEAIFLVSCEEKRCGLGLVNENIHWLPAYGEVGAGAKPDEQVHFRLKVHKVAWLRAHLSVFHASGDAVDFHMLV